MPLPTATANLLLDALTITHASLHTDFPGTTGANEVTGGAPAYARKAVTINVASGKQRLLNAAVTFDVPACTVKWIGFWNNATFLFAVPNGGGTPKNFMALSTDLAYSAGHGYADTNKVVFYQGTAPGGATEGTTVFVRDSATDTFKVAATSGGAALDLTTAASFGCVVSSIVEDVYAVQGTHQLATATLAVPD